MTPGTGVFLNEHDRNVEAARREFGETPPRGTAGPASASKRFTRSVTANPRMGNITIQKRYKGQFFVLPCRS